VHVIDRVGRGAARALTALPEPILRAIAGGPVVRDGQVLDPQLAALLAVSRRLGIGRIHELPVPEARVAAERGLAYLQADPRPMAHVIDTHAPGPAGAIAVRVFVPRDAAPALVVFFHGGGGVIGSVPGYDPVCRLIADRTRCVVASVEYRLGPEHPFPAGLDDAIAAFRWARDAAPRFGAEPARIALAGDSMGGYLAIMVERRERSAPRPAALGLIYPAVDLTMSEPSIEIFREGFLLTRPMMDWFLDRFCPDVAGRRAISPLFFDDLTGVPPTVLVAAGFDPLRDEDRAFDARLRAAGARVIYREHASLVHGFIEMAGAVRAADAALAQYCDDLRALLIP
jgi:acetyl esterase